MLFRSPPVLPKAYAVIHPRHPDGEYPFGDLSGAGVAFKLAHALLGELPVELAEIACIGTIADLVSLTDENRSLVKLGLQQLNQTERIGLSYLFQELQLTPGSIDEKNNRISSRSLFECSWKTWRCDSRGCFIYDF